MDDDSLSRTPRIAVLLLVVGVVGIGVVAYGVWMAVRPDEPIVEITKNQDTDVSSNREQNKIYVDVSGAVEKPGVYTLSSKSRIGDALVAAGGLSAAADRDYVSKNINLAQVVKDGEKVFVPADQQIGESASQHVGGSAKSGEQTDMISINTASLSELDTLPGIGEARAQAIIAGRPYSQTDEIVTKAKIPQSVYDKIKDSLSVY